MSDYPFIATAQDAVELVEQVVEAVAAWSFHWPGSENRVMLCREDEEG